MQYILDINYHLNVNLRLSMYTTDMYNIIFNCNKLGNIIQLSFILFCYQIIVDKIPCW